MRFTDGKTTWDTDAEGWNWTDWAEMQVGDSYVVSQFVDDWIDYSNPVKIAGAEYSAVRVLEAIDPMLLSQIRDSGIDGFGEYVRYWLEKDGRAPIHTYVGDTTYRVIEEGEE